jgi:hypothetical protein
VGEFQQGRPFVLPWCAFLESPVAKLALVGMGDHDADPHTLVAPNRQFCHTLDAAPMHWSSTSITALKSSMRL